MNAAELLKYSELKHTYGFLFLTDISLYHFYVILIGLMTSALIVLIIIIIGFVEVYKPIQRLKVFSH